MARRDFSSGSYSRSAYIDTEDADPRVGLVNLADVMLVFACGLMLALVAAWNLDVSRLSEVVQSADYTEVDNIEDFQNLDGSGTGYNQLGMVYQDPRTGKMYMLQEDLQGGSSGEKTEAQSE